MQHNAVGDDACSMTRTRRSPHPHPPTFRQRCGSAIARPFYALRARAKLRPSNSGPSGGMADAGDSKSPGGNPVRVRLSPRALCGETTEGRPSRTALVVSKPVGTPLHLGVADERSVASIELLTSGRGIKFILVG